MPEQIIHRTEIPGIDLVPDSRHAMKYNNAEPWAAARDLQIGLRDVVEAVRDRYDMVLIDCPPNLHLCSWAALVASDFLIVPLQPEDYGAQGIIDVQESVALVTELANPGLSLLGYLITMFNARKSIHPPFLRSLTPPAFLDPIDGVGGMPLIPSFLYAISSGLLGRMGLPRTRYPQVTVDNLYIIIYI